MPNSRHRFDIGSPSNRRATKRRRSSITEHSFHGIHTSRLQKAKSVTHVSGTKCHLCLGPLTLSGLRQGLKPNGLNPLKRLGSAASLPSAALSIARCVHSSTGRDSAAL